MGMPFRAFEYMTFILSLHIENPVKQINKSIISLALYGRRLVW